MPIRPDRLNYGDTIGVIAPASAPPDLKNIDRSVAALDALFSFYLEHPERMPRQHAELALRQPRHRVVCDYIAGMTDHFLLRQCHDLLGIPAA